MPAKSSLLSNSYHFLKRQSATTKPVTIAEAARGLGCSASTVRRWVAKGAPTTFLGSAGRGRGSRVQIEDLTRWRSGGSKLQNGELLERLAEGLMDAFRRDGIAARVGITERQAAGILVLVFERYYKNAVREPVPDQLDDLPVQIAQLCAVWLE
jgi:excisionase family DNA binding protein